MRTLKLLPLALAFLFASCTGAGPANTEDDDQPLANVDELLADAPDNDSLPEIGKADAVYPKQYSDLVKLNSPVKSQGSRGVCSIFATVAYMEHLYVKKGFANPDFSEQYLQWSVKNEVGDFPHTEGSSSSSNLDAIVQFGIVDEAAWPYESAPWSASNDAECGKPEAERPIRCFTNGEPPAAAASATKYQLPSSSWLNTRSIKAHMSEKKTGVVVGMTFFYQSWNHGRSVLPVNSSYSAQGYVLYPNEKDKEESLKKRAGHAILLVGWDDLLEVQQMDAAGKPMVDAQGKPVNEKGFYIFKNSWGTGRFGTQNPHGAGYGFISQKYVHEYASAVTAKEPVLAAPTEICNDTIDNDGNGATDCADAACATDPACQDGAVAGTATPHADIPDDDATGVASEITLDSTATVAALKVTVDVTHTYVGDLTVTLTHGGKTVTLQANEGGSADDLKKTFTPTDFSGAAAGGVWKLVVVDGAGMDTGTLNSWGVEITTP